MKDEDENPIINTDQKVTVQAADIEGIAAALGMELIEEQANEGTEPHSEELYDVLDTLADIYGGVQVATENDSRGRSRKMVQEYAERGDLTSEDRARSPRARSTRPCRARWQSLANPPGLVINHPSNLGDALVVLVERPRILREERNDKVFGVLGHVLDEDRDAFRIEGF